ncbi:MAG: PAS domain S-box protein [Ferruginibacter sp.]
MTAKIPQINFLENSGELGKLILSRNWSKSSLGTIENWPQSLKTSLSICLNSRFPMFLWWGPEFIAFYNDAYSHLIGSKHPKLLGSPAKKIWEETWDIIGPIAEQVYKTGSSTWSEDELLYLERNGYRVPCYFTYSYSPLYNESGDIYGIYCTVTETTEKVTTLKKLEESEKNFSKLIMQAPIGLCIIKDDPLFVETVNEAFLKLVGKQRKEFETKPYWEVMDEAKEFYKPIFDKVLASGATYTGKEHKVELIRNGKEESVYVDFVTMSIKDPDNTIQRLLIIAIEVTDKVTTRRKIEESEINFRQLADSLPQLTWTTDNEGRQLYASRQWEEFSGIDQTGVESWIQIVHPLDINAILKAFSESLATGKTYQAEVRLKSKTNNYEWHYVIGKPIRNDQNEIEKWTGAFTNINDKKLGEESLKLQAQVLDNMDEGVSVSDDMGFIIYTNDAEDKMFGYEHGELIGKHVTIQNAYPQEENITKVTEVIDEVASTGSWTGEWFNINKNGTTFYTQSHISSINVGGRKLMVCVQRDITRQKAYEQELKRFKFMADNARDPFILMKEDGSFAYLNDLALERWGYNREEALHLRVPDVDPLFGLEKFNEIFSTAQLKDLPQFETIHKRKDGTQFPVEINMGGLQLNGRPYLFGVARDITERKRVREELNLSLQQFRNMSDTMAQFVWTADADGKLNYFNHFSFEYSGKNFEDLQRDGWINFVHEEDKEENIIKWMHSVKTGEHFFLHHRLRRKDGAYRWQLSRAIPQLDSEGKILLWVGTSTDIHDQKLFEEKLAKEVSDRTQELSEANNLLQKSNAELEQYAYVASHDLQEPLRKIRTFASMLQNGPACISEKEKNYVDKIISSSERMTVLINDILNFSKLAEADHSYVPVELEAILQNVIQDMELEIENNKVVVEAEKLPVIEAIPIQMNQLFFNLMSNSLKFAREEVPLIIKISVQEVPSSKLNEHKTLNKNLNYVHIIFSDNGIGFDQQYAEKIFNIFQRLNNRSFAGSGIGLALCRRIVNTHHGEIYAASSEQNGAAFHIFLPLRHSKEKNKMDQTLI